MATTAFAKAVKKRLIDMDRPAGWLYEQVSQKTGKYFDSSYYNKIVRGTYAPQKMVNAICEVLDLDPSVYDPPKN